MDNLSIAQQAKPRPIECIASEAGLAPEDYEPLGRLKGKFTTSGLKRLTEGKRRGKLILVTAINPTPAGEGKTTVSVGLAQGLNRIGKSALPALREPALGPVFGVKGGACGGGYSQVLPMEEINLFFNGDFPAITAAHGLLSAMIDSSLNHGNPTDLDSCHIWFPRAVDMIDRALREIVVGLGTGNGPVRSTGFVITPASEIMATLCLSDSFADLKTRVGNIIVGLTKSGDPVRASEIHASGAMCALLRDAIRPNLVQTMEGGPAIIHGGPFGNIAHGCSSIQGTRLGLGLSDYVVTEGGFGSDLGGEKFLNIVCPRMGERPDAIVLVATVRALKYHGNGDLQAGMANLGQHMRHVSAYGPPVVVAINKFKDDSEEDLTAVAEYVKANGGEAILSDPWMGGGPGCEALAQRVVELCETPSTFTPMYERSDPLHVKLEKLVKGVYGGRGVIMSRTAQKRLAWAEAHGYGDFPVCVAKTQMSLSDDAHLLGAPKEFDLHVRELKISAGAGFIVAVCGDILLMPGMGKTPAAVNIDVDDNGVIHGLH